MGIELPTETPDINVWVAASDGNISQVKEYLQTGSVDVKDSNGYTCLHAASSYGHLELVEILVKTYGANIHIVDNDGDTPLHSAQDAETARLLVELGADPTIRNHQNRLPIEVAFTDGNEDVVEYLKQFTPDFERIEDDDEMAEHKLAAVLEHLADQGVSVSIDP